MHIVEGLCVCLSVFLPSHLSVSISRLPPFGLYCSCTGSQALLLTPLFSEEVLHSVVLTVHCPHFPIFCVMRHYNGWTIFLLERGSLFLSGCTPTLVKAKSCSEMLSLHLRREEKEKERKEEERKWGREVADRENFTELSALCMRLRCHIFQ